MKQLEAVIFDWAGTTVDYGCMAPILAMQKAFAHHHLPVTIEEIRQPMGMLKIDHIKTILSMDRVKHSFHEHYHRDAQPDDIAAINQQFEENIFSILHQHTTIIPDILDVQQYLRDQHIKIGSTTGYTTKMIAIVAESAKKQGYTPDYIISSDEVKHGRPYPYMLHQNIAALDVKDTKCVVKVGDTIVDILEGRYAGCWSIGVIKGGSMLGLNETEVNQLDKEDLHHRMNQIRHDMLLAGADFVIDSIGELPSTLGIIQQRLHGENHHAA